MPSTRRQKAKARRPGEMGIMMPDFKNMDVLLCNANANPLERELANTNKSSISINDTEAFSQQRGNSSQENEVRGFSGENTIPKEKIACLNLWKYSQTRFICVFHRVWTSLMSVVLSQINRVISSAINDRVIPKIQNGFTVFKPQRH